MNILTLAAYERARRALRGECEPNSRAGRMRTNISNEPSANIVKMREVCSRPRRLRQNKKDRQKRSFWSKRRDSNPRSPVPETGAIPPSLRLDFENEWLKKRVLRFSHIETGLHGASFLHLPKYYTTQEGVCQ